MPNMRIGFDNAFDRSTPTVDLTAAPTATYAVGNLQKDYKVLVHRSTNTGVKYDIAFASGEALNFWAAPWTNWSPSALVRTRVTNEASTTNHLTYSPSVSAANWAVSGLHATTPTVAASGIAPDGTNTAWKLIPTATAGLDHYAERSVSGLTDNARYSGSVYIKKGEQGRVCISLIAKDNSTEVVEFNLDDGRMTRSSGRSSAVGHLAQDVGNGWWRIGIKNWNVQAGGTTPKLRVRVGGHARAGAGMTNAGLVLPIEVVAVTSPVAGYPVEKLVDTTASGSHLATGPVVAEAGKALLMEMYVKYDAGPLRYIALVCTTGTGMPATQGVSINPSTGAIVYEHSNAYMKNIEVTDAGSGWWKVSCVVTPPNTGTFSWQIRMNNVTNTAISSYAGDATPASFLLCKPYISWVIPDNTMGPVAYDGRLGALANGTTDGTLAWGAMMELGPEITSFYPTAAGSATIRPVGYMDAWQSYTYDSGFVQACAAPAIALRGRSAVQAATAYAYGGGQSARQYFPNIDNVRAVRIEVSDASNLTGAVECSRFYMGKYWSPVINCDYGLSIKYDDDTTHKVTAASDLKSRLGTRKKRIKFNLSKMAEVDRLELTNLMRGNGKGYPMFVSFFPEDSNKARERDYEMYCKLSEVTDMVLEFIDMTNAPMELIEM